MANINKIADVIVRLRAGGIATANFGSCLVVGLDTEFTGSGTFTPLTQKRTYSDLNELSLDFATTTEVYKFALSWFSADVPPATISVGLRTSSDDPSVAIQDLRNNTGYFTWFGFTKETQSLDSEILLLAQFADANNCIFINSQTDSNIIDPNDNTNIAVQLESQGSNNCFTEYNSTSDYCGVSTAALYARINFNAPNSVLTAFGKSKPGCYAMPDTDLNTTAINTLDSRKVVYYTEVVSANESISGIVFNPVTSSSNNLTIEKAFGKLALQNFLEVNIFNVFRTTTTRVDQTPKGQKQLINACKKTISQFNSTGNGYLGEFQSTNARGETVTIDGGIVTTVPTDIFKLTTAQKDAHLMYPINMIVEEAGTGMSVSVIVDLN